MDIRVKAMDLDVNIMDSDTFNRKVEAYLSSDKANILLLATSRLLIEAGEDENLREILKKADAIVPGEETLLSMYPAEALERGCVIVNYQCLSELLVYLSKNYYTLYMVARSENELQMIKDFFEYSEYNIAIAGGVLKEKFEDEQIINEINGLAPDILLVDLDTPEQEKWIMEYRTRINTKLCVGLGGIMQQMAAGHGRVPAILYTLHLDGWYKKLVLNSKWMKEKERAKFQKKLKDYREKEK